MEATAEENALTSRYFAGPLHLQALEFYWEKRQEDFMKLPEWPNLKAWNERLADLCSGSPPPVLYRAIMLLESLAIPPLAKCTDRSTRKAIRNTLARPDVSKYKMDYLMSLIVRDH